jgi:D-3-phosphoglycerate dehydrogenase
MKWRVLVSAPYMQPVLDEFKERFVAHDIEIVVPEVRERLSEAELLEIIGDIDGVVAGDDRFTIAVFEKAKRLKVISKWGTGVDSFDHEAARRHGVTICSTSDAFSGPVADSVLGYCLMFARKLHWMDRQMRQDCWEKIPAVSLSECRIGVIGVGNVGKAVIRRAAAFGMKILGNDIAEISPDFIREFKVEMTSKENLLGRVDFVSLNCDLNPTSYHIIAAEELRLMKQTSYLINTARGALVEESALQTSLETDQIAGAALDVFEHEPLPSGSPLRKFENCLLAPHNANSSPRAWRKVHENTFQNLVKGLKE